MKNCEPLLVGGELADIPTTTDELNRVLGVGAGIGHGEEASAIVALLELRGVGRVRSGVAVGRPSHTNERSRRQTSRLWIISS